MLSRIPLLTIYDLMEPLTGARKTLADVQTCIDQSVTDDLTLKGYLVLMVTAIEATLCDLLTAFLLQYPERLPDIEHFKSASLAGYATTLELIAEIALKRANAIFYGRPLPKAMKGFFDTLGLPVCPAKMLEDLDHIKTIRNAVVHRQSVVTSGFVTPQPTNLSADDVRAAAQCYSDLLSHIDQHIRAKYGHLTRVAVLRSLWDHVFTTPLLRPFDAYWVIDEQKDTIHLVHPKPAVLDDGGGLATSEVLYMDVWISFFLWNQSITSFNVNRLSDFQKFIWFIENLRRLTMYGTYHHRN